jgi:hypothetical protein
MLKKFGTRISRMTLLKKEDFSPQRRKDHKGFLWAFSVLGVLSVLAVPFSVDSSVKSVVKTPLGEYDA